MISSTVIPWTWPLAFVGMAMFFAVTDRPETFARRLFQGYSASLAVMTLIFYWLTYTMVAYGHLPVLLSLALFLVYAMVFGTKMPFLALLSGTLQERLRLTPYLVLPLAATTVEMVHFSLFPWFFGITQLQNLYFLQIADVVGMAGITFFMAVLAVFVRNVVLRRQRPKPVDMVALVATLALVYGYGVVRLHQVEQAEAKARPIQVLIVQPDSPLRMERDVPTINQVVETCRSLTLEGARASTRPLDLVVWPEGATPFFFNHREWAGHREFTDTVEGLARSLHVNFFFNDNLIKNDEFFNNVWMLDREANPRGNYQKVMLLAFGEYMPFSESIPFLRGKFGVSNFRHGSTVRNFETDIGVIAPQVCYEILYPNFTRRFIGMGADFIVNGTNDAWFGPTTASLSHLEDALPRAVENRVPLVRCTNSGISTVISAGGRFLAAPTPLFEKAYRLAEIRSPGIRTFYTLHGDMFGWTCVGLTAALLLLAWFRPSPVVARESTPEAPLPAAPQVETGTAPLPTTGDPESPEHAGPEESPENPPAGS